MENQQDNTHSPNPSSESNHNEKNRKGSTSRRAGEAKIIVFNVGGQIFETLRETIQKDNVSVLSNEEFLRSNYLPEAGGYFFDRDPDIFRAVLNYLRTGELHLPSYVCGPAAKTELIYWGVPPSKIERCCWTNYNDWNTTLESLKRFEKDRKLTLFSIDQQEPIETVALTTWRKWSTKIWRFLTRSNSSTSAKVMGIISLFFVSVSIFAFIAETTEPFHHHIIYPNAKFQELNVSNQLSNTTVSSPKDNGSVEGNNNTATDEKYLKIESKHPVIFIIDMICLGFFTVEYLTRFVCAPRKLKFLVSILALVDLLAILPDYVELLLYAVDPELQQDVTAVQYISILRIVRVLRIFRLVRHVPGLWILVYTIRASFSELMLLVWFMVLGILVFASLIYFVDDRDDFKDIPEGFWWALITMTTVGYGDMYPKTQIGKVVGSFCAICGVLMIGFTVPALVNNFILYYRHLQFAVQLENQCEEKIKEEMGRTTNLHTVQPTVSMTDFYSKADQDREDLT